MKKPAPFRAAGLFFLSFMLLVNDLIRLFLRDRFQGLYHITLLLLRAPEPDLSFDQAVLRTTRHTIVVFPVWREPANHLLRTLVTQHAAGASDLLITHCRGFTLKLSRDVFGIGIKPHMNLILTPFGKDKNIIGLSL